jgi:polygalacturonase
MQTLNISQSKNVSVEGLTLRDSKNVHMKIFNCTGVGLQGLTIVAPGDSPNTDGMHVQLSTDVSILGAAISTGDDCVSLGPGTSHVVIRNVTCGPGHGISIGSMGGEAGEAAVRNVTVEHATLRGTQNGLRIQTWGKPYRGLVTGVTLAGVTMVGVQNPIIVDQNCCPDNINCGGQVSHESSRQLLLNCTIILMSSSCHTHFASSCCWII